MQYSLHCVQYELKKIKKEAILIRKTVQAVYYGPYIWDTTYKVYCAWSKALLHLGCVQVQAAKTIYVVLCMYIV